MAETASLEVDHQLTGEFRSRQRSFHSNMSKTAPKRPAADSLDCPEPQRLRLEDESLSMSAPTVQHLAVAQLMVPAIDFKGSWGNAAKKDPFLETTVLTTERAESSDSATVPSDMTDSSSPALESPPGSLEEEVEEVEEGGRREAPQRIVRPEDISLHNPDSGLGYRASKNEYHTDDSDDGHDDDEVESEKEDGEVAVTEPEDLSSHPISPLEVEEVVEWIPQSPSPSKAEPVEEVEEVVEKTTEQSLPFTTPLDLQCTFDPSIHMGLLMIDPSHQDRFNQLHNGFGGYNTFNGGNNSLFAQYERLNAARVERMENALLLNTDCYDEVEEVEVIEEEEYHPPNPPSSPAYSQHE